MSDQLISVSLPQDENGMVGRQCPSRICGQFFKIKLGTGQETQSTSCPYCGWSGDPSDFTTADQLEYAKSVAFKQILDPLMRDFKQSVEGLNRRTTGSLVDISFKVDTPKPESTEGHRWTA